MAETIVARSFPNSAAMMNLRLRVPPRLEPILSEGPHRIRSSNLTFRLCNVGSDLAPRRGDASASAREPRAESREPRAESRKPFNYRGGRMQLVADRF